MSPTPCTPQMVLPTSLGSTRVISPGGDDLDQAQHASFSPSAPPPRAHSRTLAHTRSRRSAAAAACEATSSATPHSTLRRHRDLASSPLTRSTSVLIGGPSAESPFEPRPPRSPSFRGPSAPGKFSDTGHRIRMKAHPRRHNNPTLEIEWPSLFAATTEDGVPSPSWYDAVPREVPPLSPNPCTSASLERHMATPSELDLAFNINFGDTPGLDFCPTDSGSRLNMFDVDSSTHGRTLSSSHVSAVQSISRSRAAWRKGKGRRTKAEISDRSLSPDRGNSSPSPAPSRLKLKSRPFRGRIAHTRARSVESSGGSGVADMISSSSDSDQTPSSPRLNPASMLRMVHPLGLVEQRCSPPPFATPYYTARSTPDPDFVPTVVRPAPQAGPSRLPPIDTNVSITAPSPTVFTSSPLLHLGFDNITTANPRMSTDSPSPPSPALTADFSMISPPTSPTWLQYCLAEDSSTTRGTATLPFFRGHSPSPGGMSGVFHRNTNSGRTQNGGFPKARRVRPGISRLWESISSPSKSSPGFPSPFQGATVPGVTISTTTPSSAQRRRPAHVAGFSAVRSKPSPMRGAGRRLKEKRRLKQARRSSTMEVDTDVDYGALDPLDGEEGELVGCTCTGWGDGACLCGYGYSDMYDYEGDTQDTVPVRGKKP